VLCFYRGGDHQDFSSILCVFELFLERKKCIAIVLGLLNERARYLREGISLYIAQLAWVSEHSTLLEKSFSRLCRNTMQIQLYEIEIAALH